RGSTSIGSSRARRTSRPPSAEARLDSCGGRLTEAGQTVVHVDSRVMSPRLSPVEAALEGLRVVRREPWAVAYWIGVWAVALALIAIIRLATGALAPLHPSADGLDAFRRFGPLALVLAPTLFVLWTMTTATVYRAVLRPGEHGWHLFKLGPDEARIAALSAVETLLLALLGGVPAYLLLVLLNPIFEVAPGFSRAIAIGGFVATILINAWLAVRLSLL